MMSALRAGRPLAVLLVALLGLFGCPARRIDFGPRGEIEDPAALLELIKEAESKVVTLTGESKIRVDTPEARGAFSMFTAVSRPSLVHLEPLDFFGKPQAVLVVHSDQFGLYDAQQNLYYRGPASPQNVSRFLPIALPAPELTLILLGAAPRIPHERAELRSDDGCACYILALHRGEATQTLQVHPRSFRVLRSEIRGVSAYDLQFEDIAEYGMVSFPRRVRLRSDAADVDLDLRYTEVTLNQAPDLTMFDLEPPEGVPVVEVEASGRPTSGEEVPEPTKPTLQPDTAPEDRGESAGGEEAPPPASDTSPEGAPEAVP